MASYMKEIFKGKIASMLLISSPACCTKTAIPFTFSCAILKCSHAFALKVEIITQFRTISFRSLVSYYKHRALSWGPCPVMSPVPYHEARALSWGPCPIVRPVPYLEAHTFHEPRTLSWAPCSIMRPVPYNEERALSWSPCPIMKPVPYHEARTYHEPRVVLFLKSILNISSSYIIHLIVWFFVRAQIN